MHGSQIRLREHLNSMSNNSAHAPVEHDGVTGARGSRGWWIQGTPPSKPSKNPQLPVAGPYAMISWNPKSQLSEW